MASSFLTSWLPQSLAAPSSEGCKSADKADAEGGADNGAQQPAAAPPSQQGELSKGRALRCGSCLTSRAGELRSAPSGPDNLVCGAPTHV